MFSRSLLTTIIGFLIGWILYLIIEPLTTFIFLFGGLGYVTGLILDNTDRKRQIETFHFSSIPSTHEILHSDEIPEAVFIYSFSNNTTSVLLDYRIEAKPENYRLSVLKNLQEFDFRIVEGNSQTFFSLCIEYPELNYPSIKKINHQKTEFYYDIIERSNDFQGAIQKLIPGIVICIVQNPDIFGNKTISDDNSLLLPPFPYSHSSPSSNSGNKLFDKETEVESKISKPDDSYEQATKNHEMNTRPVDEEKILEDLTQILPSNEDLEIGSPDNYQSGENGNQVQTKHNEGNPQITSKSTNSFLLTAKQIEESQDHILTHEETEEPQTAAISKSIEIKTDKKSSQGIFDYSSVDTSSSMPLDTVGQGILLKIQNSIKELEAKQAKNPEKITTEDA